jgi:hypothetical protein
VAAKIKKIEDRGGAEGRWRRYLKAASRKILVS